MLPKEKIRENEIYLRFCTDDLEISLCKNYTVILSFSRSIEWFSFYWLCMKSKIWLSWCGRGFESIMNAANSEVNFSQYFIYHFVAREILYRMVYNSWGFILIMTKKNLTRIGVGQFSYRKSGYSLVKSSKFWANSAHLRTRPRYWWDKAVVKISWRSDEFFGSYRVNGRTDGHTDRF